MVKLNARCSAILQNELSPKEKDPGSFLLPCTGSTTVSNALDDLGTSISVMPFFFIQTSGTWELNEDPTKTFCNPDGNMSIELDDFDEMDDMWDDWIQES
ncbi:hypothetical protein Tco_0704180 [Tanacetum coccineum]|uniref:Uncharacterized protein n=1 Tax=Tanacetum coccineum TaxID=301880 RepID=A0ABQ4Y123_9ASTR